MPSSDQRIKTTTVDDLYAEAGHWHVNTGEETIHAKRMAGVWRTRKWLANSFWLLFFFGPYLRWDDRQAVLFDIPSRQFHLFGATVLPQDFWMLALLLLFFAILLAVVTVVAGRVWCGFFCFQTVWTDVYTWIEEKIEGSPQQRRKLDKASWGQDKLRKKSVKHLIWMLIALFTGISFVAWFNDAFQLWADLLSLRLTLVPSIFIVMFFCGTYLLAGFMREQTCFWLCPYARIQGVMLDRDTVLPTYDFNRGEPRGRVRKGQIDPGSGVGDCVDCNQCVAVCPTGVDIRDGQQEGCITCALCIDACDTVMDKLGRPPGLIRYESLDGLETGCSVPLRKRPRVWAYNLVLLIALGGIVYGLSNLDAIDLTVIHERQPLFVLQSDGSIQNKYTLKVLNKLTDDQMITVRAEGPEGLMLVGWDKPLNASHGNVTGRPLFVRIPRHNLSAESVPIRFIIETEHNGQWFESSRDSVFIGPRR